MEIGQIIINELYKLRDEKYRIFHSKLMPNIDFDKIIGVRIPDVRSLANQLKNNEDIDKFLASLPHKYYEENNLHSFIIEQISDYEECVRKINEFLPYIDNWATCDSLRPRIFKKNTEKLLSEIKKWINSKHCYTIRFGIEMLMIYYLDKYFSVEYLELVSNIKSDDYYVKMMIAWYFATALSKQYNETIKYIENKKLDSWIHNKTIQKSIESYRISDERKAYLKTLKIK